MVSCVRSRLRLLPVLVLIVSTLSGPCLALNCVEYVRHASGMELSGDAWQWWGNANGRFERGHAPKQGAILVFDRTPSMEHGHVAIVSTIMGSRLITINHANWAHLRSLKGHVSTGVQVQDVSDKNDWSVVRVLDETSGSFGRDNRILGFVYNKPGKANGDSLVASAAEEGANGHPVEPQTAIRDIDNE